MSKNNMTRSTRTELLTGRLRLLKEKRCQLLEIIHKQQQELDQLDYQIYKLVQEKTAKEHSCI